MGKFGKALFGLVRKAVTFVKEIFVPPPEELIIERIALERKQFAERTKLEYKYKFLGRVGSTDLKSIARVALKEHLGELSNVTYENWYDAKENLIAEVGLTGWRKFMDHDLGPDLDLDEEGEHSIASYRDSGPEDN